MFFTDFPAQSAEFEKRRIIHTLSKLRTSCLRAKSHPAHCSQEVERSYVRTFSIRLADPRGRLNPMNYFSTSTLKVRAGSCNFNPGRLAAHTGAHLRFWGSVRWRVRQTSNHSEPGGALPNVPGNSAWCLMSGISRPAAPCNFIYPRVRCQLFGSSVNAVLESMSLQSAQPFRTRQAMRLQTAGGNQTAGASRPLTSAPRMLPEMRSGYSSIVGLATCLSRILLLAITVARTSVKLPRPSRPVLKTCGRLG